MAGFEQDDELLPWAEAFSLDMVDCAKAQFAVNLDWTDDSIRMIELRRQSPLLFSQNALAAGCAVIALVHDGRGPRRSALGDDMS